MTVTPERFSCSRVPTSPRARASAANRLHLAVEDAEHQVDDQQRRQRSTGDLPALVKHDRTVASHSPPSPMIMSIELTTKFCSSSTSLIRPAHQVADALPLQVCPNFASAIFVVDPVARHHHKSLRHALCRMAVHSVPAAVARR